MNNENINTHALRLTGMIRVGLFIIISVIILFLSAGRLDWAMAWVYVTISAINSGIMISVLDPGLLEERMKGFKKKESTKQWDFLFALIIAEAGPLAMLIISGLEIRFEATENVSPAIQLCGLLVTIMAIILIDWAMYTNNFFSAIIRIQKDRGQAVISGGPYRFVRHPGYAGVILQSLALPFMLGTPRALLPGIAIIIVTIIRTVLEDRVLHKELNGYDEYAMRVRYRLIPLVW